MNGTFATRESFRLKLYGVPLALLSFVLTQNTTILNPRRTGWLWNSGDISASFTQWIYFRQTPLVQWPLTLNSQFGYPWTKTIVYTDTPPLFALPLKYLLGPIDGLVQFTGLQVLLSTYLLIIFSALILLLKTTDISFALLGGLAISTSPILIFRDVFNHYSLNIIWVIPAAIYLVLQGTSRASRLGWASLFLISLLWMPYFIVAIGLLWLPHIVGEYLLVRKIREVIRSVIPVLGAVAIGLIVNGFWYNSSPSWGDGLGFYNANLLALINPLATPSSVWSQILPSFTNATEGQYEGFAFLGIGLLSVALFGIVSLVFNRNNRSKLFANAQFRQLAATAVMAFVLSTGFVFHLGTAEIARIPIPVEIRALLSVFRSSGRFMILVALMIALGGLIALRRAVPKIIAIPLILIALLATLVDSRQQISFNKSQQGVTADLPRQTIDVGRFLDSHAISTVTFIPPENSAYTWKMQILAASAIRNLPVNDIFAARPNDRKLSEERDATRTRFQDDLPNPGEAWVIYPEYASMEQARINSLLAVLCSYRNGDAIILTRTNCK